MSQEILVGPERRRRWSDGEKIAILIEAADLELGQRTKSENQGGVDRPVTFYAANTSANFA